MYIPLMMVQVQAESTWVPISYGSFINQFPPDIIKSMRQLERTYTKICKQRYLYWLSIYIYIYTIQWKENALRVSEAGKENISPIILALMLTNWIWTRLQHVIMAEMFEEEQRKASAVTQAKQCAWTKWNDIEPIYLSWKSLIAMKPLAISLLLRSTYDLLPNATKLKLWGYIDSDQCLSCKSDRGTLCHVLYACPHSLQMYT